MIATLTNRHLRIYFRDRMGVFFSFLSPLILIALYKLFLGNLQVENLTENWPTANGSDVRHFVDAWVFAGTVMITTLTTGLAAMNVFVDDRASGRSGDFLVSPIRRRDLIFGYMLTSFLISSSMSLVVLAITQIYTAATGAPIMHLSAIALCIGYVLVMCATFAAISSVVVTFVSSNGAFSSLSTIVGTFAGFLAMAYIPTEGLPAGVVRVLNWLPFAQAAKLVRGPLTERSLVALTSGQPRADSIIREDYGISIALAGHQVSSLGIVGILAVIAIVFSAIGSWRLGRGVA